MHDYKSLRIVYAFVRRRFAHRPCVTHRWHWLSSVHSWRLVFCGAYETIS